jgi:hypothetical protein
MKPCGKENIGLELMLKRYKKLFRIPENVNHYSKPDFLLAEKKFIKYSLARIGV